MVYANIVARYLKLLSSDVRYSRVAESRSKTTELLRYSLCKAFGLPSTLNIMEMEYLVKDCIKATLRGMNYKSWSIEYKQGVLEGVMIILNTSITKSLESKVC